MIRAFVPFLTLLGPAVFMLSLDSCKLMAPPKASKRILTNGHKSLVDPDSVQIERSGDGSLISLSFEASKAVDCELSFFPLSSISKIPGPGVACKSKSATTFSEVLTGAPKDQLVAIIIKSWDTAASPATAASVTVNETSPKADENTLNLLLVDIGARRLELTAIGTSSAPSAVMSGALSGDSSCWLSTAKPFGINTPRKALLILGATSKGFINSAASRTSPYVFTGIFSAAQRQSTEWSVSAKTTGGSGQLRIATPTLLNNVTFAGRNQSQGISDSLDDVDPPALGLDANTTLVTTWSLVGDGKSAVAILTIPPYGAFPGITCQSPAIAGKITVPTVLVAKIPTGSRLWASLRLDSWQALDADRWAIRVSDWKSMGITRQ